ncbi:uncharacterized protein [Arachis hypogaea]|uniref:uncharacterized protein isoform X2 n=1 Tax=Arachis hypogaea TaxID=3818 RepID=UPI003B21B765
MGFLFLPVLQLCSNFWVQRRWLAKLSVMDEDLFLMVRSGVCSDGGGTTRNMFLALHKVVLRIRKRKSLLEEVDKILEAQI